MNEKIIYTPAQANEKLRAGTALLVDVRDPEQYASRHIPGAVNIPEMFSALSMTDEAGLQDLVELFEPLFRQAGVRHDQTVIVYEESLNTRYGGSCRGYFQLSLLGHRDVGILDGGLSQWRRDGFALTAEPTVATSSDFCSELCTDFLATLEDTVAAVDDPAVKLLDNRDADEWRGISSSPYGVDFAPRKGRIPGARWLEWYEFMDEQDSIPHFKSPEEIRTLCAQVGLEPEDDIIIYCFKGARASNTLIALKLAGFTRLRNYYGSWNEWSRHARLPIDDQVLAA